MPGFHNSRRILYSHESESSTARIMQRPISSLPSPSHYLKKSVVNCSCSWKIYCYTKVTYLTFCTSFVRFCSSARDQTGNVTRESGFSLRGLSSGAVALSPTTASIMNRLTWMVFWAWIARILEDSYRNLSARCNGFAVQSTIYNPLYQACMNYWKWFYRYVGKRTKRAISRITLASMGWNTTIDEFFQACKAAIANLVTLAHRDEDKRLCIYTDASDT